LGFNLIRVYDCGENTEMILRVIDENNIDIKVMLGIWLRAELSAHLTCSWLNEPIPQHELDSNKTLNRKEIQKGIELANKYPHIISFVNVGNEALVEWNDHMVDVDSIITYVKKVKSMIDQEVTVADNYDWWAKSGNELAEVVDFVSVHIYPVWEGRGINEAMSYSIENLTRVAESLPGKRLIITEAGWATTASEFGERASEKHQLAYYHDLMMLAKKSNITTFWFEAFDEDWKGNPDNPIGAEKHWGLYKVDRKPKVVVKYIKDNK
jgi:exo-beta-1,3-glucanase (GH17 family)